MIESFQDGGKLSELALNYSDALDASALDILQQLQSLRVREIKRNVKSNVVPRVASNVEVEAEEVSVQIYTCINISISLDN